MGVKDVGDVFLSLGVGVPCVGVEDFGDFLSFGVGVAGKGNAGVTTGGAGVDLDEGVKAGETWFKTRELGVGLEDVGVDPEDIKGPGVDVVTVDGPGVIFDVAERICVEDVAEEGKSEEVTAAVDVRELVKDGMEKDCLFDSLGSSWSWSWSWFPLLFDSGSFPLLFDDSVPSPPSRGFRTSSAAVPNSVAPAAPPPTAPTAAPSAAPSVPTAPAASPPAAPPTSPPARPAPKPKTTPPAGLEVKLATGLLPLTFGEVPLPVSAARLIETGTDAFWV